LDALVTDVHFRSAVAGVRGLGRAGLEVIALGPGRAAAGRWSRYASRRGVAPEVADDPVGFMREAGRLAERYGPLVMYPCREETIDALLGTADRHPPEVLVPYPGVDSMKALRDKARLPEQAARASLRTPEMYFEGFVGEVDPDAIPLPCLVKQDHKRNTLAHPRTVQSREELEEVVAGLPQWERLIAQEHVAGDLMALSVVIDKEGRIAARFQQRAKRTWPPGAGPSTVAVSVPVDEELVEKVRTMLADAGYWGLAQLQFIAAPEPALIDVNLRFYGSLALALASGVNLPAIWHDVTLDRARSEPPEYQVGVTYRWLENEFVAAIHGRPKILLSRLPKPKTGAMWAPDDPVPGVLLAAGALLRWLARRVPRRRRHSR